MYRVNEYGIDTEQSSTILIIRRCTFKITYPIELLTRRSNMRGLYDRAQSPELNSFIPRLDRMNLQEVSLALTSSLPPWIHVMVVTYYSRADFGNLFRGCTLTWRLAAVPIRKSIVKFGYRGERPIWIFRRRKAEHMRV